MVIEADRTYWEAYHVRGRLLYASGNWEAAIRDFTALLKTAPAGSSQDAKETYMLRGLAAHRLGDHDDALRDLTAAIELDPQDGAMYARRALVYKSTGENDKADTDMAISNDLMARAKHDAPETKG